MVEVTPAGHRMVLAIVELADAQAAQLARDYEAAVSMPEMPWHMLKSEREFLWAALVRRSLRGEVTFRGVLNAVDGAVTISPDALRGSRPDYLADTLEASGALFHSVSVFETAALCHTKTLQQTGAGVAPRGKGGVAATYDWDEFVRELTRALFAGELISRRDIKRHMTAWCSVNWSKQPDETSIRNALRRYLSADIPETESRNN